MSDGHRLAQLMREAGKTPQNEVVDIVIGQVTSVKPLKVKVENRELTESFLILGALCKETHISGAAFTIPTHTHTVPQNSTEPSDVPGVNIGTGSHTHVVPSITSEPSKSTPTDVLLWRGLRVGDRVLMLKVGRGQKYFIMQREEGI